MGKKSGTTIWVPDKKTRDDLNKLRHDGESTGEMLQRKLLKRGGHQ